MSFLRVPLFTLIYYLLLHLGFCKAEQNCFVALIKIMTVYFAQYEHGWVSSCFQQRDGWFVRTVVFFHEALSFFRSIPNLKRQKPTIKSDFTHNVFNRVRH